MNLSISNLSFNFEESEAIKIMQKHNFNNIELSITKKFGSWDNLKTNEIKDYKNYLNNEGLQVCSLQSLFYGKDYNLFHQTDQFIEHFKSVIEFSNLLECKYLVFGSPRNRRIGDLSIQDGNQIFINTFKKIAEFNKEVTIGIETNPMYYNCDYLCSYYDVKNILQQINKENIKFHFDLACVLLNGDSAYKIYDLEKNNLDLIHISCKDLKSIYNDVTIIEFFDNVKIAKNNTISIEMLNQTKDEFEKSLIFLNSCLSLN